MKDLIFRPTFEYDIGPAFAIRASTRQNPVSIAQLAEWGITPESAWQRYASGEVCGWVCEDQGRIVAFGSGDLTTGEVLVLAVLPQYEGKSIGKTLLSLLIRTLHEKGCASLWLAASPEPKIRAHGFYRSQGWVPNGKVLDNGDEILVYT